MDSNIGIYICKGCTIGNALEVDALVKLAEDEFKPILCKEHPALCSENGCQMILEDINHHNLNSISIVACSPRVKTEVFKFKEDIIVDRVNIREQVVWCSEPDNEDTQMMAEDYIRISLTKLNNIAIPTPFIPDKISSEIMIVGGGITGLSAALEGARAGYKIHLVEQEQSIGGWSVKLNTKSKFNFNNIDILTLIEKVNNHEKIQIYTSTKIIKTSGQPGAFDITLNNGEKNIIRVGSIIAAMGWQPYDASKISVYRYSQIDNIITSIELETMLSSETLQLKNGKIPEKILFIQCAGSRDKDHLAYCSNYCCNVSLKQASIIREKFPDSQVFIIYKDIRATGLYEEFYKEVQKDSNTFFTKGRVNNIKSEKGSLLVSIDENLFGEEFAIETDLVVLATGMIPNASDSLHLEYRQGGGLPELKYSFTDSHFICFPYETRRTGIYAAGTNRAPMDIDSCSEDAAGAILKAIQCIEATKRGEAVHPRVGDKSYPELYMDRCTDCKRCTEECPFGMYDETEKGTPLPNPSRCRRCGICVGSCPERVINFKDYSINSVSAMVKSVCVPDEFEEKPRILVFACENDAYPAIDTAGIKRLKYSPFVRIIPVRCIGSVNKVWISDALSKGYDGILQIGCKPGDNYQCHFIHGSELTEKRGENIQETLETMMLEPERIKTVFVEITDFDKIPDIINNYVEEIELIGPNPFKDM